MQYLRVRTKDAHGQRTGQVRGVCVCVLECKPTTLGSSWADLEAMGEGEGETEIHSGYHSLEFGARRRQDMSVAGEDMGGDRGGGHTSWEGSRVVANRS